jgi:mono/diheme cytochrome c family protein
MTWINSAVASLRQIACGARSALRERRTMRIVPGVVVLAMGLSASLAQAAGDTPDVSVGRALALAWCAECHRVAANQAREPRDDVPTFFSIADHPSTTETGLRVFLATPHADMPDIMLTREQMDEIVAYILSLASP